MTARIRRCGPRLVVAVILAAGARPASAQHPTPALIDTGSVVRDVTLDSFALQPEAEEAQTEGTKAVSFDMEEPGSPVRLDLTYSLYSDYVFRGVNFSEYAAEGREKPNHQVSTTVSFDLARAAGRPAGQWGTFAFGTFSEWYAAQKMLDPEYGGQNLQEADYTLSWSYDVEAVATTLTLGYAFYTFPNAKAINTSEWFFGLEHNDAWMWKGLWPDNTDGILNPAFRFAQDVDAADGGCWMEFQLSHDFELFENFTLTPAVILAMDHRWLDPVLGTGRAGSTRLAYVQYGLTGSYDLTPMLCLPKWAGSVSVAGFLYFNDALGSVEDSGVAQDELFGGMSIGWSWGE